MASHSVIREPSSFPDDVAASDIQARLNSTDVLPPMAFRRNHAIYELVSYVNCLLGCRMAGNLEGEGVFRARIAEYMATHDPKPDEARYYQLVRTYVANARASLVMPMPNSVTMEAGTVHSTAAPPPVPVGKIKSFGPFGPKYEVGNAIRELDDGDWLVEVTRVETGEKAEYRLTHLIEDPEAP